MKCDVSGSLDINSQYASAISFVAGKCVLQDFSKICVCTTIEV